MKIKIDNYSFNKTAKTITFSDYTTIRLDGILLITNVTRNIIIYNFAAPTKGGTVLGNVLTLTYDTSSMNNADKLLIYYDDTTDDIALASGQTDIIEEISNKDIMIALKSIILGMINPPYIDKSANQLRVQTTGTSTVTFASNQDVRTLTTLTNFGAFPANYLNYQGNFTSWQLTVRNKIT